MRQNTKIMGPIKIHGEEGKLSPQHKYNVELGCGTSKIFEVDNKLGFKSGS
jgi:hypothetical protein